MSQEDFLCLIAAAEFLETQLLRLLAEKPDDLALRYAYKNISITILHLSHLLHKQEKESL